jgi:hypothetical protein
VLLADRCVRQLPEAVVDVEIPGYKGKLKVCAMSNPVCTLIIGNDLHQEMTVPDDDTDSDSAEFIEGSQLIFENSAFQTPLVTGSVPVSTIREDKEVDSGAAVQTRHQVFEEAKSKRSLKVTEIDAINITPEDFIKMQECDDKLHKYWDLAKNPPGCAAERKGKYIVKRGLLYREYREGPHTDLVTQLVVPSCLEEKVIAYAHDTVLSAHGSIASTYKKLSQVFHVLGATTKCRDYVKSCLLCQKGGNSTVGGKAPLQSMPIIGEPMHTVYIDIVGEIHPPSAEGHRYILCFTDACSHFPFAIPLKRIDSVSVAEALLSKFSIFGHPKRVISDNAPDLTSDILKEIYHLYGIQMQTIPVYRPQANSIQERSHAVIKSILRKLVVEQSRQWHRFLDPIMFAIRTTANTNNYTPFELMFGRQCRTHLAVLKDLWTGHDDDPETKTTYQYVLDLRNRIEQTCEFAQKEIVKTHLRNVRNFNKHAKLRELTAGDKVLVISPNPKSKLEFIWKGPAQVG